MYKLAAKFDFKVPELPGFLIASLPDNEQPNLKVEIRDFVDYLTGQLYNYEVKTTLISESGPRIGNSDSSKLYTCFINRMIIYVERQEDEEIPQDDFLKRTFFIVG